MGTDEGESYSRRLFLGVRVKHLLALRQIRAAKNLIGGPSRLCGLQQTKTPDREDRAFRVGESAEDQASFLVVSVVKTP